jgi:hypothetical protein
MEDEGEISKSEESVANITYKRMKLANPESLGFVRRSSRAYKGKRDEYCELSEDEIDVNFQKMQVSLWWL